MPSRVEISAICQREGRDVIFRRTVDGFVAQLKNPKKPSINRTIVDLVAADVLRFASRTQEVSA